MPLGAQVDTKRPLRVSKIAGEITVVKNLANPTVYYRAGQNGESVSSSLNDGSLAKGASLILAQTEFFIATEAGAQVEIRNEPVNVPSTVTQTYPDVREYGPFGANHESDNREGETLEKALTAAQGTSSPSEVRKIQLPGGRARIFAAQGPKGGTGIRLVGTGGGDGTGAGGGFGPGTEIIMSEKGGRAFDFRNGYWCGAEDVAFYNDNKSFGEEEQVVMDLTGAQIPRFDRCTFGTLLSGQQTTQAMLLVGSNSGVFNGCKFVNTNLGLIGRVGEAPGSFAHTFNGCIFFANRTAHVWNSHANWTFNGCVFEPLFTAAGVEKEAGSFKWAGATTGALELNLVGCWHGGLPAKRTGIVVDFIGEGLNILGGEMGEAEIAVRVNSAAKKVKVLGPLVRNLTKGLETLGGTPPEDVEWDPVYGESVTTPFTITTAPKGGRIVGGARRTWGKVASPAAELAPLKKAVDELREAAYSHGVTQE